MNEDKDLQDILDMVEKGVDFLKENDHIIEGISPGNDSLKIDETTPLKSANVEDGMVYITVEERSEDIESIEVAETDEGIALGINGKVIDADVPDDARVEDASATLNNGVLDVEIPREGGE